MGKNEEIELNCTFDAQIWVQEWLKTIEKHPDIPTDEGTMLGWFANAIMAGYDHAYREVKLKRKECVIATDVSNVSDGYHTFGELYEHRHLLFLCLAVSNPSIAFKTWLNDKKEAWFILGINTDYGQITYHLPGEFWDAAEVTEKEYDYDGHTSEQVLARLKMFTAALVSSRKPEYPQSND